MLVFYNCVLDLVVVSFSVGACAIFILLLVIMCELCELGVCCCCIRCDVCGFIGYSVVN